MLLATTNCIFRKELETPALVKGSTVQARHVGKDSREIFVGKC